MLQKLTWWKPAGTLQIIWNTVGQPSTGDIGKSSDHLDNTNKRKEKKQTREKNNKLKINKFEVDKVLPIKRTA